MHNPRNSMLRSGFTLIELLAAVALATLLLTAAASVLRALTIKRSFLMKQNESATWIGRLEEQLRWDVANARRFEVSQKALRLVGYATRDFETQLPTHCRSDVVYRLLSLGQDSWLIRDEMQPDLNTNVNRRSDVVCKGVTAIMMKVPGMRDGLQRSGSMPKQFRILLMSDKASQPVIDVYCCH